VYQHPLHVSQISKSSHSILAGIPPHLLLLPLLHLDSGDGRMIAVQHAKRHEMGTGQGEANMQGTGNRGDNASKVWEGKHVKEHALLLQCVQRM
jgi:hypothetical protein